MQVALSKLKEIENDVGAAGVEGKGGVIESSNEPIGNDWIEMSEVLPSSQCPSPPHPKQSEMEEDSNEMEEASCIQDVSHFSVVGSASEPETVEMELKPSIVGEYDTDGSIAENPSEPDTPFSQVNYVSDWCDEDSDDEIDTEGIFKYRSGKKGVQTFKDDENDWKLEDFLRRTSEPDCFCAAEQEEGDTGVVLAKFVGTDKSPKLRVSPETSRDREECEKGSNVITSDELDQEICSLKWDKAGNQMYLTDSPFPPRTFIYIANGRSPLKGPVQHPRLSPEPRSSDPSSDVMVSGSTSKCKCTSPVRSTLFPLREEGSPHFQGQAPQNLFETPSTDISANTVASIRKPLSPTIKEESSPQSSGQTLQTVFKKPSMDLPSNLGSNSDIGPHFAIREESSPTSPPALQILVNTTPVDTPSDLDSPAGSTVDIKNSPQSTVNGTESTVASPSHFARSAAPSATTPPNFFSKDDPPLPFSILSEESKELSNLMSSNRVEPQPTPLLPKFTSGPPQFTSQTRASSVPPHFSPCSASQFASLQPSDRGVSPSLSFVVDRDAAPPSESTVPVGVSSESSHASNAMSPLHLGSPLIGSSPATPPTYPVVFSSENVTPRSLARQARLEAEHKQRLSGPNFDGGTHDVPLSISPRPIAKPRRRRLPQPNRLFGNDTGQSFVGKKNKVWEVDIKMATDTKLVLRRRGDPSF